MEFKLAKKCDAEKVYALVQETIKVVYPKYYLKEIVDMFCEFHSRENIIKDIEAGNTYILMENEEIIGTGTKNGNHITRVYVLPEYQKKGYGKILLDYALDKATEMGFGAVFIEGNINFYRHCGLTYAREYGISYHGLPDGADQAADYKRTHTVLPHG